MELNMEEIELKEQKHLYKGTFNNSGEILEIYTNAYSFKEAYYRLTIKLTKRLKLRSALAVRSRFPYHGGKDNYKIVEVRGDEERVSSSV